MLGRKLTSHVLRRRLQTLVLVEGLAVENESTMTKDSPRREESPHAFKILNELLLHLVRNRASRVYDSK